MSDFASRTLADIASTLPGATRVFRAHKLDFCCGGQVPLAEAAAAKGIAVAALEQQLAGLDPSATREAPEETPALIAYIEERFHAVHRAELPELLRLAQRVEAAHRDNPVVPAGIASLIGRIASELEEHQQKEEQILFPLMRAGGHPMIGHPIAVMLAEHDAHGQNLVELEKLTHAFTPPPEACPTWRALYTGLAKFADDLMQHVHTENNILFPRFAASPAA